MGSQENHRKITGKSIDFFKSAVTTIQIKISFHVTLYWCWCCWAFERERERKTTLCFLFSSPKSFSRRRVEKLLNTLLSAYLILELLLQRSQRRGISEIEFIESPFLYGSRAKIGHNDNIYKVDDRNRNRRDNDKNNENKNNERDKKRYHRYYLRCYERQREQQQQQRGTISTGS